MSFPSPARDGAEEVGANPQGYVFNSDTGKVVTVLRCVAVHSDIRSDANGLALPEAK